MADSEQLYYIEVLWNDDPVWHREGETTLPGIHEYRRQLFNDSPMAIIGNLFLQRASFRGVRFIPIVSVDESEKDDGHGDKPSLHDIDYTVIGR